MSTSPPLVDGVLVINLDERQDRWQGFLEQVSARLSPLVPTRLPAVKGIALPGFGQKPWFHGRKRDRTWAGRAGCTLSHRSAIAKASEKGWKRVLILEDDIELAPAFETVLGALPRVLDSEKWDICYLGYTDPIGPFRERATLPQGYRLDQLYGCNTTHAYLVNQSAYRFLLDRLPTESTVWHWLTRNRAIDRWYARTLSGHLIVLAVSQSIINQKNDISDITGRGNEQQHLNAISRNALSVLPYRLVKAWRHGLFWLEGCYDAARGWIKRRRGF